MPIRFLCTACRAALSVAESRADDIVPCPRCGQRLIVPLPKQVPVMGIHIEDVPDADDDLPTAETQLTGDARAPETLKFSSFTWPDIPVAPEVAAGPPTSSPAVAPPEDAAATDWIDEPAGDADADDTPATRGQSAAKSRRGPRASFPFALLAFYGAPVLGFLATAARFWNENRAAAILCLSGALSSTVIGTLHLIGRWRSARPAGPPVPVSWTCKFCGQRLTADGRDAGRRTECTRCKAIQRVPAPDDAGQPA